MEAFPIHHSASLALSAQLTERPIDSKIDSNTGDGERTSTNKGEQEQSLIQAQKRNEGHQARLEAE
jgi:hypothetical protein